MENLISQIRAQLNSIEARENSSQRDRYEIAKQLRKDAQQLESKLKTEADKEQIRIDSGLA